MACLGLEPSQLLLILQARITGGSDRQTVQFFPTKLHHVNQKEIFCAASESPIFGKNCTQVVTSWFCANLSDTPVIFDLELFWLPRTKKKFI